MRSGRSFPGPWRVESLEGGNFVVKDATAFPICYVYARKGDTLHNIYMTPAEVVVIAEAIARLKELAPREQTTITKGIA
jgi:hypothetical protein